jgi:hypothetical protein
MPEYDLRSAFPLNEQIFPAQGRSWRCRLMEVSDLRPERDRLAWYLSFQTDDSTEHSDSDVHTRKLEVITSGRVLTEGFSSQLAERIADWLASGEVDGRREWLETQRG